MAHQKISSIRRNELVQATMSAIYEHGFADLTVAQIAKDAQVSTGNIHYYFGSKEALLEATMRYLLSLLRTAYRRHLSGAETPTARLHAVVQANFDESFLTLETCRAWTQFWAFAPYHPKLARLHQINRARVRSNLVSPLRKLIPEQNLQVTTNAIQGYMDGVWIQIAQTNGDIDLGKLQCEATQFTNQTISNQF